MTHDCTIHGCPETFDTMDELVDHLTDQHDAFSKVSSGRVLSDA